MIGSSRTKIVSFMLVCSLAASPLVPLRALAQDAAAEEQALTVQPGDLSGSIVDLDGKTPVKGATVQLLDKDGKVVAEGATDEKGSFSLGKRETGKYTLQIGNASGKLVVKEGAQASALKFVLENTVALGSKKDAKGVKLAAISTTGVVIIAVAVGVVGLGAGLGIGYGVWGSQSKKKVYIPVSP